MVCVLEALFVYLFSRFCQAGESWSRSSRTCRVGSGVSSSVSPSSTGSHSSCCPLMDLSCPAVPLVDLSLPEDQLARTLHNACSQSGFFIGGWVWAGKGVDTGCALRLPFCSSSLFTHSNSYLPYRTYPPDPYLPTYWPTYLPPRLPTSSLHLTYPPGMGAAFYFVAAASHHGVFSSSHYCQSLGPQTHKCKIF